MHVGETCRSHAPQKSASLKVDHVIFVASVMTGEANVMPAVARVARVAKVARGG